MGARSEALAKRIIEGAEALAAYSEGLSDEQWTTRLPGDGRQVGVLVHHVASVYPLEVQLAQTLAAGKPIEGVAWSDVAAMNANHAKENAGVTKAEALALLKKNSAEAADAIRVMSDAELDSAATVSLNGNAPLTAQFFVEDHALRHSFHHLSKIKATLG